jgi:hypothetical protein
MKPLIASLGFVLFVMVFTHPLCGQEFDELLEELSGSETDEEEREIPPSSQKKETSPLPPSSNELQAQKVEEPSEEDDFESANNIATNGVTLQGLDKQTGRVYIITALVGQPIEFGTLNIVVQRCEQAPPEKRQESLAFIKITEQKPNSPLQNLFSGWMFSSSPPLSALDHPIYDVWVKKCKVLK